MGDAPLDDDYPVENVTITVGDYMSPRGMTQPQFDNLWEALQAQGEESIKKLELNYKSMEAAVEGIIQTLNMQPCANTGKVESGARGHTLNMTGVFLGGHSCLVRALIKFLPTNQMLAQVTCRSKDHTV